MTTLLQTFSLPLLKWYDKHGRKNLPWQHPRSPYQVWISEIMLQQTQVKTVIPYFTRFMASFPTIQSLAQASEDDVLAHWSGLGYYSRGRNLHKTATIIHNQFNDHFPDDVQQLIKLPGIGPSTAAAITSLAFGQPTAILDGNVKRILSRYFLISGALTEASVNNKLWELAEECMPASRCADYSQAIMDLGATCCTPKNPHCVECPLHRTCLAKRANEVANYPNKKPKKTIPTKQQQFLLLHNDSGFIYLEKRPPTGIWGGLWCLPSIEIEACPLRYVRDHYDSSTMKFNELGTIKHTFSHFHLMIKARSLHVKNASKNVTEDTGQWVNPTQMPTLGLAKPISMIIKLHITR